MTGFKGHFVCCACLVTQSCLTFCNPMDGNLAGYSVHGDSPGKNTGVGCCAFPQGKFQTQALKPGLPHCRQILYCVSYQGSPRILKWVTSILQRNFPPQELNWALLHCRQTLYQLSYKGSPQKDEVLRKCQSIILPYFHVFIRVIHDRNLYLCLDLII